MLADVIAELNDVLGCERFARYVSEEERARFLQSLLHEARLVEIGEKVRACRDPKDDKFLELAVNGEADCIVSGDDDLLSLDPFRGIQILAPDKFLNALSKDRPEEK